ncbi:MAG: mechanosensitive ion channel protein MscS [Anaerolineaceae bacterium]|nr:mechanosensitive ion channel protein MscS [Anaerolineaceae bacterium]
MDELPIVLARIQEIINGLVAALPGIVLGLITFGVFYVAAGIFKVTVERVVRRSGRTGSLAIVMGRLARWTVLLLGLFVALTIALPSLQPSQLIELLGISSVAFGFAFRDILQNFLAGILLLFTQPFWIGDQIIVGDFEGTVEDIHARASYIQTYDGRRIVIPNAVLFTESVIVNTAFPKLRTEYQVGIGYGDDIDTARALILEAVDEVPEVLSDPAPTAWVTELAASSVNIGVWWWTESRRADVLVVKGKVLTSIKNKLVAHGIDLPFQTQHVLFHDQTEETDGDRSRQREGWPAGDSDIPKSRSIAASLRQLTDRSNNQSTQQ